MSPKPHIPKRIAPRLASGEKRVPTGNGLPPIVKFALRSIADSENRSMSYIIEEILVDWARHHRTLRSMLKGDAVAYIPRKTPTAEEAAASFKAEQKRKRDEVDEAVSAVARRASR
jgi:hypothetical protein